LAVLVIGTAVRAAVSEPDLFRFEGPVAVFLLVPAAVLMVRIAPERWAAQLRPAALAIGAVALGVLAWAVPDPADVVPWLTRHAGLFVALTLVALVYLEGRWAGAWATDVRRVGVVIGALALAVLGVVLAQQIPLFDPATKTTPLGPLAVGAVLVAILAQIVLSIRLALRPDRDPLGPTATGRTGYVYLAAVLLVLVFVHVRLNVPQVFTGQAVRYWTFIVMLLAFVGTGLAELFARRGLPVLSRPLLRTGVLLPLIPLLIFWAKPPDMLFDYLAVRLNGPKAAGKKIGINIDFIDLKQQYGRMVENAVLNYGKPLARPDVKLTMSKATLDAIQLKQTTLEQAITKGDLKVEGKREAFAEFMSLLDTFPFWFNVVTP